MTSLNVDRLRVFVSSTIKECAAERSRAREVIRLLNHEPVLFEDVGARPHPPPPVYRARLDISHIFVAIYRESYGWIAPDMDVSGIEDEFGLATARGMDRLVYVYQTPAFRDPKLQDLIDLAKNSGVVVARYTDAAHLADRLRNDLTATISGRFVDRPLALHAEPSASDVLTSLIPNRRHRLRRRAVEARVADTLRRAGRVLVTAPLGGGKTILTAQASAENGWLFVDAQRTEPPRLLARVANCLRHHLDLPAVMLTSEQAATQELLSTWDRAPEVTLVVDGASDPLALWDRVPATRRLVVTARHFLDVPPSTRCDIPCLTPEEVGAWSAAFRGRMPDPGEVAKLVERSGGNPLYLRFLALEEEASADLTLRELEIRAVRALPPRAREIIWYVAISPRRLSLEDLTALLQANDGSEAVAGHVASASGVVEQRGGLLGLVHEHFRETVASELREDSTRLAFFANRLGRHFEKREEHVAAFHVYVEGQEQHRADRVVGAAAYQAALMGGGAPAVAIFRRQADLAGQRGSAGIELHASLNLAWALRQCGGREEARFALDRARGLAAAGEDEFAIVRVKEAEVALGADDRPRSERVEDLERLRERCIEKGDSFSAARVGILLTVEYIAGGEHRKAADVAREVRAVFEDLGDEYGRRVARLNLASALSGIPGEEDEAGALAQELEQEIDPDKHPRERAVICNYLARYFRRAEDPERGTAFALEAIGIGEELRDVHVIAINRITVGNICRDQGKRAEALLEYHRASEAAVRGALRDSEAAATQLIASVYNDQGDHGRALVHALHAAAVGRMIGAQELIARADEERARAHGGLREQEGAVCAYADAAQAIGVVRPGGRAFVQLLLDGLHLCGTTGRDDLRVELLSRVFLESEDGDAIERDGIEVLCRTLPRIADGVVTVESLLGIVGLALSDVLASLPEVVRRRVVLQAVSGIMSEDEGGIWKKRMAAVAAILMSQDGSGLTLGDMVDIGEAVAGSSPTVYFRPYADGAAQWTVRLNIGDGAVISVQQMDDDPTTSRLAAMLALLLDGLDGAIREGLLDVERLPRDEALIVVASRREAEEQLGSGLWSGGPMSDGFAVSKSRDIGQGDQPPMLVVREEGFPAPWRPREEAVSDVHLVFGQVLERLVPHFLAEAIEPEILRGKIVELIRRLDYRGPSGGAVWGEE